MVKVLVLRSESPQFDTQCHQKSTEYTETYVLFKSMGPNFRRLERAISPKILLGSKIVASSGDDPLLDHYSNI